MKKEKKQDQCSVYERRGQLVLALNCEKMIPEEAPVRLASAVMEELDYEEVVADAGYECLDNCLYLDSTGQTCFIKPTSYDQKKRKKFKKQIGRVENMAYDPEEDCFTCAQGRKLPLRRECTEIKDGQFVSTAWYRCEDCSGCPCRNQCCRAKDPNQPRELCLQKTFWEKRAETTHRITSGRGIHLRLCRSTQVEGALGLLKNDFGFRRFLTRGKDNIRAELCSCWPWPLT